MYVYLTKEERNDDDDDNEDRVHFLFSFYERISLNIMILKIAVLPISHSLSIQDFKSRGSLSASKEKRFDECR